MLYIFITGFICPALFFFNLSDWNGCNYARPLCHLLLCRDYLSSWLLLFMIAILAFFFWELPVSVWNRNTLYGIVSVTVQHILWPRRSFHLFLLFIRMSVVTSLCQTSPSNNFALKKRKGKKMTAEMDSCLHFGYLAIQSTGLLLESFHLHFSSSFRAGEERA